MFKGSMVALVTPMNPDGSIDNKALEQLVEWHIASKTDALVVAGTTGESATLTSDEKNQLIAQVVKQVAGRIPVIAGTGTNNTQTTLKLTMDAKKAGADACLVVTPYYNKPTQKGLYQHYKLLAEQGGLPIILYNVPGRTGCDLLPETIEQLAKIKNIIGIKEATGNLERGAEIRRRCGKDFYIYSGDDETALKLMQQGAEGVISVTANVAPEKMQQMCEAALAGNHAVAEKLDQELMLLHKHLFSESNPIPTKWALWKMNKIQDGIRLPLLSLDEKFHNVVTQAMQSAGAL